MQPRFAASLDDFFCFFFFVKRPFSTSISRTSNSSTPATLESFQTRLICRVTSPQNYNLKSYRVFRLDSTPFIPLAKQLKLHSCSMGSLSRALQGPCYRYSNFLFSKKFKQFFENSNSRTENGRNVQFMPKCAKYNVVLLKKNKEHRWILQVMVQAKILKVASHSGNFFWNLTIFFVKIHDFSFYNIQYIFILCKKTAHKIYARSIE